MLYLTCTMISSVDLAHYGVSRAKDQVSVDCGTANSGDLLLTWNIRVQDYNRSLKLGSP